ncbi:sensor domain-containing diguanylate cyclase [Xanthobacter tagetidis]|uniref:diguanylate cyclase n=1 Tax=Xanthobacter tagetidis TaxID=60216 RepID=A0A3L7AB34_9HYPH|nr:GGDEF domain-containing protein [Xanthobacter tagetidis]
MVLDGLRQRLATLADRLTLAQQIALAMGVLFAVSLAAVAFLAAAITRDVAIARIEGEMRETARSYAGRLEQEMRERLSDLTLLAASEQMKDVWGGDPARLRAVLDQLAASMDRRAWIGFVRADGTVASATRGALENQSVASEGWFREALAGPTYRDIAGGGATPAAATARGERAPPAALLALPVAPSRGEIAGALVAQLSLDYADALRRDLLGGTLVAPAQIWLLSRDGRMLLGPKPESRPYDAAQIARFLAAKSGAMLEGAGEGSTLTGFAVADGDAHAPFIDWIIIARQPAQVAFSAAWRLAGSILAVGFAVLLLTLAIAAFLARRIAWPLVSLAGRADAIGRTAHSEMLPRQHGSREIVRLSGALRALLRRVGAAEERVSLQSAQHAKDLGDLRRMAETDALTGLLNRHAFQSEAALALAGTRASDTVGLLMVDIDHFKRVNDTFGHKAGDLVLAGVSAAIAEVVRGADRAARIGGEEFVVLTRDVDAGGLVALAERLRAAIGQREIDVGAARIRVTASIGATLAGPEDRDIGDVMERADQALYAAKRSGRDRVALRHPPGRLRA